MVLLRRIVFGLASFYRQISPSFATNTIPLNDLRSQGFERENQRSKCFLSKKQKSAQNKWSHNERILTRAPVRSSKGHKPLQYLFSPDEEMPKTASTRITRWAIALMAFDYKLKRVPEQQIPRTL